MSFRRQHIRNTRAVLEAGTPMIGEYPYDTDLKTIRAGDGAKLGGHLLKKWGKSYALAPAQIVADQNDYNPADLLIAEAIVIDLDADRTITGIAGGELNRELTIYNGSAHRLTLSNENAASLAANRFHLPADVVLRPYQSARFLYSATLARWLIVGAGAEWLGVTDLPENVTLSGVITPAQIAADQNDYNPAGLALASRLRVSSDAAHNLTGLAGGTNGRIVVLVNVGANQITLKDASVLSAAANRFDFGADIKLTGKQVAVLQYDATDSRWKMVANTAGAAVADGAVTASKLGNSAIVSDARLVNGTIVESHAGGAVTFAIKTLTGGDPSAVDPVLAVFPNETGGYAVRSIAAALSLTISSGSTLGIAATTPIAVHVGLVDTGAGVVIGAGTNLPDDNQSISTTAEGGAGTADSAGVIYTTAAQASKPWRRIATVVYANGLATAGVWAVAPDKLRLFSPGAKPGDITISFDATAPARSVELDGSTIAGGVASYPLVAARYPWMRSGADLKLPDMRGRFMRVWAHGSTSDPDRAARAGRAGDGLAGDNVGTTQSDQFASHNHATSGLYQSGGSQGTQITVAGTSTAAGTATAASGGNETRPININISAWMVMG